MSEFNTGSFRSNQRVFERLGFEEYEANALGIRSNLYSWFKRVKKQNTGSLQTLHDKLTLINNDIDLYTRDEKIAFIKSAVTTLLDNQK